MTHHIICDPDGVCNNVCLGFSNHLKCRDWLSQPKHTCVRNAEVYIDADYTGKVTASTIPLLGLPQTLTGWQYGDIGQMGEDWVEKSPTSVDVSQYKTVFKLDESIEPGPGIVPYNSSIYVNGVKAELATPFLYIGQRCTTHDNFFTSLGSCVCYRGEPIEYEGHSDDNMSCVSKRGYVWGFASFLTLVGLILKGVWAIGCWCVWLDANVNSNILKNRRSCVGVTRNALDLAESVNRDVGTSRTAYSDKELEKALKRCDKITYPVEDKGDVSHIDIVSEGLKQKAVDL
jgi:hypothetical protein